MRSEKRQLHVARRGARVLGLVLAAAMLLPAGGSGQTPLPGSASVSLLVGLAKVQHGAAPREERVAQGMSVKAGDVLTTLKGARVELKLKNGSVTRVGEQTIFAVEEVGPDKLLANARPLEATGDAKVWVRVEKAKGETEVVVKTPVVLTAVHGTVFHLLARGSDATQVRVYEGTTKVAPLAEEPAKPEPMKIGPPTPVAGPHPVTLEEFTVLVKAMQEVTFTRANLHAKQEARSFDAAEDRKDDWVAWNLDLDVQLERGQAEPATGK